MRQQKVGFLIDTRRMKLQIWLCCSKSILLLCGVLRLT
jgi:hypothetical protein